jgi:hypothetical protein
MKSSTPSAAPSSPLARFERKNELCAQSWKMMKVRSRKPAAGSASASASSVETRSAKKIATSSRRYGATEVPRSIRPRARLGSL